MRKLGSFVIALCVVAGLLLGKVLADWFPANIALPDPAQSPESRIASALERIADAMEKGKP